MTDFAAMIAGIPGLKDMTPEARSGMTERVVAQIVGAHRWPFLLKVQETKSWAANDAIQKIVGVSRLWSVMFPDSGGDYYRLTELSDIEFQKYIENNPNATDTTVWRDAGYDGNDMQIELYGVPAATTTLKLDYTLLPDVTDIDSLPFRFQGLVMDGMIAAIGNYGAKVAFERSLQNAISREMDLQGKRDRVGMDNVQAMRMRNISNPS